jgi:ABC-2 type transport system ATP-binding protein
MIHVERLTKYYGNFCAVDRIDLDVQKGEITGLLGPNGAGKTTTLRMLTGYLAPTSGSIRIKDYSIDDDLLEIKKLIGYLPESAPLYHNMLVYDYLDYIANIRSLEGRKKIERIHELSDLCGLSTIMHKPIGELSKGLKQRVGLAHAMLKSRKSSSSMSPHRGSTRTRSWRSGTSSAISARKRPSSSPPIS